MLSDRDIQRALTLGDITIRPFRYERLQPASYDLSLGECVINAYGVESSIAGRNACIAPGEFLLAETAEWLELAAGMSARIEGRSSIGRLGLMVHVTAGFIDPGWRGKLTLELYNLSPKAIALEPGMRISQLSFTRLESEALRPYGHKDLGSHYQNATGVEPSKYTTA